MIAEFQCPQCGKVGESYFPTFSKMQNSPLPKCNGCKVEMKRIFGKPNIKQGGEISGYEKENQGHLTLGKAVDMRQKWV